MNDDATGLPAVMLGLAGFEVLAAGEYGGELGSRWSTTRPYAVRRPDVVPGRTGDLAFDAFYKAWR